MVNQFSRNCPSCKKVQTYSRKDSLTRANKNGGSCPRCSRDALTGTNHPRYGMKLSFSDEHKRNMKWSEERKQNMREIKLKRIEKYGWNGNANSLATHVFTKINERLGWNGQHYGHPLGEKQIVGYKVDYYYEHPECILVIEWDEPFHLRKEEVAKDQIRQQRIEKALGDTCVFLRLNQKTLDWREILTS